MTCPDPAVSATNTPKVTLRSARNTPSVSLVPSPIPKPNRRMEADRGTDCQAVIDEHDFLDRIVGGDLDRVARGRGVDAVLQRAGRAGPRERPGVGAAGAGRDRDHAERQDGGDGEYGEWGAMA